MSPQTILIIDDEPIIAELIEEFMSDLGDFSVLAASNGYRGLELAQKTKPDLIVLDVQMPVMNGFQVFSALKMDKRLSTVPVIMLTGIGAREHLHYNAKDMGIMLGTEPEAYVEKPIQPETFQKIIVGILSS